ncbi:hypothetical protein GMMP15_2000004 [Candidatus Magnetomoraceae bacterium gMMP-15]
MEYTIKNESVKSLFDALIHLNRVLQTQKQPLTLILHGRIKNE